MAGDALADNRNRSVSSAFFPFLVYTMFASVLARRVYSPVPQLIAADMGVSVPIIAQTQSLENLVAVAAAILLSPLSDRMGRRRILLASIFLRSFGCLLAAASPNLETLLLAAVALGIGNGVVYPQLFSVNDEVSSTANRHQRVAAILVASRTAFIVGPLAAGFLAGAISWRAGYLLAAVLTGLATAAMYVYMPEETRPKTGRVPVGVMFFGGLLSVLRSKAARAVLLGNLTYVIGGYGAESFLGAFAADNYGLRPGQVGVLLAVGPVISAIAAGFAGRISDSRWRVPVLILSSVLFSAAVAILMNMPLEPWFMAVLSAVWAVGLGLRGASVQTLVLDLAPSELGAAAGLLQVTYAAGIMVGSSAGGLALALAGYSGLSYLFAGSCAVSAIIFWRLAKVDDDSANLLPGNVVDAAD